MKLSQATKQFCTVTVDGWNTGTSSWDTGVGKVGLQVFDRFITERTFGLKKRIATAGPGYEISDDYDVVRLPDGRIYLVISDTPDIRRDEVYLTTYELLVAEFTAQVIRQVVTASPSGLGGTKVDTVVDTVVCDIERYSGLGSDTFETVKYPVFTITVPGYATIDSDHELAIDGHRYDVQEIVPLLRVQQIKAVRRAA